MMKNSSQTSRLPLENSRRLDGFNIEKLTQVSVVSRYGQGVGRRAKCPLCNGNHLSVIPDGRFQCFSCYDTKGLYAHFVADGLIRPSYRDDFTSLYSKPFLCISPSPNQRPLACVETRDAVYRALLSLSPLSSRHIRQLERRGFSILSGDFHLGTLHDPRGHGAKHREWLVTKVLEKTGFSSEVVAGVPGFYLDEQGELRLYGNAGMLIPTYNCRRQIIGMQLRLDTVKNNQPRYLWLSSTKMGGASGGAPVGFLEKSTICNVVDIVEGFFKALSLSRQGMESKGFLSMPGVGMLRNLLERLDELEQLGGDAIEKARVWFDADSNTNPNLLRSLKNLIEALTARGIVVEVKGWDPARGKGIDDYLQGGGRLEACPRCGEAREHKNFFIEKAHRFGGNERLVEDQKRKVLIDDTAFGLSCVANKKAKSEKARLVLTIGLLHQSFFGGTPRRMIAGDNAHGFDSSATNRRENHHLQQALTSSGVSITWNDEEFKPNLTTSVRKLPSFGRFQYREADPSQRSISLRSRRRTTR